MQFLLTMFLALVVSLAFIPGVQAETVGRFLQVEGPVDLLRQGKLPVLEPKVEDGVEPGDVIRTKTSGRAQVKFVDDSIITIAPGSRVGIEAYMYDGAQGKRHSVLQVFRGMVQATVSRILKTEEPDFIMKTHTAVLGVRGTKWYAVLAPTSTDVYNEDGKLSVDNLFPEIPGKVVLGTLEFTRVTANLPPTIPSAFDKRDLAPLQRQLSMGVKESQSDSGMPAGGNMTALTALGRLPGVLVPLDPPTIDPRSSIITPPNILPPPPPPPNPRPPHPPRMR